MFRRIASKTRKVENGKNVDMFYSLGNDQAAVIRQKLLETLATEPDRAVRNKICDAVAEIARQYVDSSQYNQSQHALWLFFLEPALMSSRRGYLA